MPIAETVVYRRPSHIVGMGVGKSAAEVNGGKDKEAQAQIDALWLEVKSAAQKAVKAKARKEKVANVR